VFFHTNCEGQGARRNAVGRKVAGTIPDGFTGIIDIILPAALWLRRWLNL